MKLQSHHADAVPAPALANTAVKAVTAATNDDGRSLTVIDGKKIKDNFSANAATFAKVTPLLEAGSLCSELAAFVTEHLDGLGWFVVFNKPELESALANGVEPARLALLAGFKPAAAIKLGLKNGVKVYGCGSVSEMEKIAKAKKQVAAGIESLDIIIVLDPTELPSLDQLLQMLDMAKCRGDRVVGISLQSTEDVGNDAYTKAVAISRLAFEAFDWGQQQVVFDLGEMKDGKESEDRAAQAGAQLRTLPTALRVQLAARVGQMIMKDAVGLAVKVTAVNRENKAAVVNESIYGAFSGLFTGQLELEPPHIVAGEHSQSPNATYDIFGSSGEDSDVILVGTPIVGLGRRRLSPGDWVIFPNLTWPHGPESSVHLSSASATPPSPWMTLKEDYSDISELEALFTLPDLTEEALENMFNV